MNPETSLVWHPLQGRLKDLRTICLANGERPPHWFRIESKVGNGFPDLWWGWGLGVSGTIELKHRALPPVGEDTPCVIESIQPGQRLFWRQAAECGALVHVLTRVGREWFLHHGEWARLNLGVVTIADMRLHNIFVPPDAPDRKDARVIELPNARRVLTLCGAMP